MLFDDPPPPVIRRARREIYRNRAMACFLDHVEGSNGAVVPDYVVVAPVGDYGLAEAGVTVLPVQRGRVVLMRVYRHPMDAWFWEAPRGMIDPGETPAQAARRELEEETALRCPPGGLLPLGTYAPDAATMAARGGLFAALDCEPAGVRTEEEMGLGELCAFELEKALAMADNSEIEDSATLIALLRFARVRNATGRL